MVQPRRWTILTIGLGCVAAGAAAALLRGGHEAIRIETPTQRVSARVAPAHRRVPTRFEERVTGQLGEPVQDATAAALDGKHVLLLGGLTAADISRADVIVATAGGSRSAGTTLPAAVHDSAAVRIGSEVYLFGGGTNAGTQSDAIVAVPAGSSQTRVVGRLPAPSSDQAAAAIRGTAYIVGGFTGTKWLSTIVAWRPGSPARVVAQLPFALRYAAVSAVAGKLVIAGGSLQNGAASDTVLEYTPGRQAAARIARLPAPTTHAAAASLGTTAYVIGGRGASPGSAVAGIVAVDVAHRRVRIAGALANPRSDLAAVTTGGRILLFGGRAAGGAVSTIGLLVPTHSIPRHGASALGPTRSVYAHDGVGMLRGPARLAKALVYVPNSQSNSVDVIDQQSFRVVDHFAVGELPQHVVPAWDLRTLYVTNDVGNNLTPINPVTGKPEGQRIAVEDPYNMYFTPDGRHAVVVAERLHRLDFRDAHTFRLQRALTVPCSGVDHMDFTADGRFLLASCEFSGEMVEVDVERERVVRVVRLPNGRDGMPQDVKLSADGRLFYTADMRAGGVWEINSRTLRVVGFLATGSGAHGLYPSRDGTHLYVTNRAEGSISVISLARRKQVAKWRIPGGSPDMGGVSENGTILWLSGRYNAEVYAISTLDGKLLARIPVGAGPHGLCVWPQPGRYSLGHTGNMR